MWHRIRERVLLTANRGIIGLAIAAGIAAFFTAIGLLGLLPLTDVQGLFYAYSGLIAGNLTLITVIISINQLLLERELQTPDELRHEIVSVMEYRSSVESATGKIAPVKPLGFLRLLVENPREDAQRLGGLIRDHDTGTKDDEIDELIERLTHWLDRVDKLLDESETGTFNVLSLMLETNYATQMNALRRIRASEETSFSDDTQAAIDELVERFQEIDIARQYFKSIYMQQELSSLSRGRLYAGVPAVAVAIASLMALTVPTGNPEAVPALHVIVPVTLTIGLLPLSILCSVFLRTATVTKLTTATLPFTMPEQER